MYDDEEDYLPRNGEVIWPESPPYMLIYGENIAEVVGLSAGRRSDDFITDATKQYLMLRFFDVVRGFHKGQLDLTGRHMHRYKVYAERWLGFSNDFRNLMLIMSDSDQSTMFVDQALYEPLTPYEDDHAAWIRFCKRWKVPYQNIDFEHILEHVKRLLSCLEKHPDPVIQDLCLTDLPDDNLDMIFAQASVQQGRLLAATCRRLSGIGCRYVFRERNLSFVLPFSYWEDAQAAADKLAYVRGLALSQRNQLLSSGQFLIDHPDIVRRVETLVCTDTWVYPDPAIQDVNIELEEFSLAAVCADFYGPIYRNWTSVLNGCQNLTYLRLGWLTLYMHLIQSICQLPQLKILNLFECRIPRNASETFMPAFELNTSSRVETLFISVPRRHDDAVWLIPTLFTHLRNLIVQARIRYIFTPLPPNSIISRCQFWDSLERLDLSNFPTHGSLHVVADWLNLLPTKPLLKYFKFFSPFWFGDDATTNLLTSLQAPHLQVLVLSGLQNPIEQLFRSIANLFPTLRALSLDKRDSNRQMRSRPTLWPLQVSDYTRWAGHLPEFRFFGWNRSGHYHWEVSSFPIVRFETNFTELKSEEWRADEWDGGDYSWTVRAFAAYCPNLEWYPPTRAR